MALTHLSYKSKDGPDILSSFAASDRELLLASYSRLAVRSQNPDFHYPNDQQAAKFIVAAAEKAVAAINADLVRITQGELTLRIMDHADHSEHSFAVKPPASKRKTALAHALVRAYDDVLADHGPKLPRKMWPRTFLAAMQPLVASYF